MSEKSPPSADRIERMQRRRTRITLFQAVFFLAWQSLFFISPSDPLAPHTAYYVKIVAYIAWTLLLLAFIATGGNWNAPRELRAILNDETTTAHRNRGMAHGFLIAMLAALACYAVSMFTEVSPRVVIHTVLSAGIASALIVFAALERRAQAA